MALRRALTLFVVLFFCMLPPAVRAEAPAGAKVVFLSPDGSPFWTMVGGFMQGVAYDLDIDLSIHVDQGENRFSYRQLLVNVLALPDKPDYIVLMCKEGVTYDMLTMIGKAGIKAFTFNTDVPMSEVGDTGKPRQKLKHWIGHLSPDNRSAGRQLVTLLHERHSQSPNGEPPMLAGLTGTRDSSSAIDRNLGFQDALSKNPSLLNQLLFARWNEEEAYERLSRLIDRHPQLDLVWSASDGMAMGAINAIESRGLLPGTDVLVGSIDWEPRALDEIESGRLAVSLGRHFMGGGLALLLIGDYHHGFDFADHGPLSMSYDFEVAHRDNLGIIRQLLMPESWQAADFRVFSKYFNNDLRQSSRNASRLLDGFVSALSATPN